MTGTDSSIPPLVHACSSSGVGPLRGSERAIHRSTGIVLPRGRDLAWACREQSLPIDPSASSFGAAVDERC